MALATESITPLKNAKLIGPLDCNGQLLVNADPASFPPALPPPGGIDTGTSVAILKGDGNHGIEDAVPGTHYATPAAVAAKEDASAHSADIGTINGQISTINGQISSINSSLATKLSAADLAAFAGTSSISTVGTITTGTWNASPIGANKLPTLNAIDLPTADLSLNGKKITNLADPTNATDGASKQYVDAVAVGGVPHAAAAAASIGNLTLSGEQTIDGVATSASRVLAKNQSTASQNGIYVTAAGAWTRATDADTGTEIAGSVFISGGTNNGGTTWGVTTAPPITIGSTAIVYTQTGANTIYSAGNGLNLTGSQFSLAVMAPNTLKGNNTGSAAAPADLNVSSVRSLLALNNVENTTLSTWAGSSSITTLGTITAGTIPAARILPGAPGSTVGAVGANLLQLTPPPGGVGSCYLRSNTDGSVTQVAKTGVAADIGAESALSFNAPLSRTANAVSMPAATGTTSPPAGTTAGYTTAADWNTWTNLRVPTSRIIGTSSPLSITNDSGIPIVSGSSNLGANRTLGIQRATPLLDGYIAASDFVSFAGAAGRVGIVPQSGTFTITNAAGQTPFTRMLIPSAITTPGLTVLLPPANEYPVGSGAPYLEFVDLVTNGAMANFGIVLNAPSGVTIDGASTLTLPRGMGYMRLNSDGGSKWFTTKYFVDSFQDPSDRTKRAQINLAHWPAGTPARTINIAPGGNSTTVRHTTGDLGSAQYVYDVDQNGEMLRANLPSGGATVGTYNTVPLDALVSPPQLNWSCDQTQTKQKGTTMLTSPTTKLAISNHRNGEDFELIVKQDGAGNRALLLPTNFRTPNNGLGLITLSAGANAVDKIKFTFDGLDFHVDAPSLNLTKAVAGSCDQVGNTGATAGIGGLGTQGLGGSATGTTKYVSFGWFTPAGNYSFCRFDVDMLKVGSPVFDIYFNIYTDNAGVPGTPVGLGAQINAASLGTVMATYLLTSGIAGGVVSGALNSGQFYHIVAQTSQPTGSGSTTDFVQIQTRSGAGYPNPTHRSTNGSAWTISANTANGVFTVYHS